MSFKQLVMKLIKNTILSFLILILFVHCENQKVKTAGCNANGIWLGNWETSDGTSGTFFTDVIQDETFFEGYIFIWFDLPSGESHGFNYSGRIEDREVRASLETCQGNIVVRGDVVNEDHVSGMFDVASQMSGTFDGEKIPLEPAEAREIYRISNCTSWEPCILFVNNNLWLIDVMTGEIIVTDQRGNLIRTIPESFLSNTSAYDGTYLWTSNYDYVEGYHIISQYDTLGNKLKSYPAPTYNVDALACDNNNLYAADNYHRRIYTLDISLAKADSISFHCIPMDSFQFLDEKIIFPAFGDAVYIMSANQKPSKVFRFPIEAIRSIAANDNKIWLLAEHYDYPENGPSITDCMVYEFQIDE
jgi:hypothetical protein